MWVSVYCGEQREKEVGVLKVGKGKSYTAGWDGRSSRGACCLGHYRVEKDGEGGEGSRGLHVVGSVGYEL